MSWRKGFVGMLACIGFGYGLLLVTVPTPEKIYESLSESDKKEVDKRRKELNKDWQEVITFIKANAASDKPAWEVHVPAHLQPNVDRLFGKDPNSNQNSQSSLPKVRPPTPPSTDRS